MIFDCFSFLNEFDVLEIRLRELGDVVDQFVITEADKTFTGLPKEYRLDSQWERYKPWHHKIRRNLLRVPTLSSFGVQDGYQRDQTVHGVPRHESDVVIISDLDEIPRADLVRDYAARDGIHAIGMSLYRFYLNVLSQEEWHKAKILPADELHRWTPERLRWKDEKFPVLNNGGWHFTSCGTPGTFEEKLKSWAHAADAHNPRMLQMIKDGTWIQQDHTVRPVEIDGTFPAFVVQNQELMKQWGLLYGNHPKGVA